MKKCITTIFYLIDNFCQEYEKWEHNKLLPSSKQRNRAGQLSLSELLTVVLYFYLSPCRDFKNYYLYFLPNKALLKKYRQYIFKEEQDKRIFNHIESFRISFGSPIKTSEIMANQRVFAFHKGSFSF